MCRTVYISPIVTDRDLRLWRGHSEEEAAGKSGVSRKVLRRYERDPSRVRRRSEQRALRAYYDDLRVLHATEAALVARRSAAA